MSVVAESAPGSDRDLRVVAGNVYDKYGTSNPIARCLMRNFLSRFDELVEASGAREIHELGCGEGHLAIRLARDGRRVRACDLSPEIIVQARAAAAAAGVDVAFRIAAIEELESPADAAELVVCCEVLEHLPDPGSALRTISELARPWALLSVPREPLWRMLNLARLRYLAALGNTPGHLNHWSRNDFLDLVGRHFRVVEVRSPLPWTMTLCRRRRP